MKYEKGCALLNVYDFVDSIYRTADEATQRDICDSLACLDPVIDHVAAQIVTGYTEFLSSGATSYPAKAEPGTALDRARRLVAKGAGDVAKSQIEELERALRSVEGRAKEADQRYERALSYMEGFGWDSRSRFFEATYSEPKAVSK